MDVRLSKIQRTRFVSPQRCPVTAFRGYQSSWFCWILDVVVDVVDAGGVVQDGSVSELM